MKLLKTLTAFLILASLQITAAQWLNVPPPVDARMSAVVAGGGVPVAAVTEYFGYQTDAGSSASTDSAIAWVNKSVVFTAPKEGNIVELSAYLRKDPGKTANTMRMALFSADGGTKICEGTAAVTVSSESWGWYGHLTAGDLTGTCTVANATDYAIALTLGGAFPSEMGNKYIATDYDGFAVVASDLTGGFGATISLGTNYGYKRLMRAGVQ